MASIVKHLEIVSKEQFVPAVVPGGLELRPVKDPAVNERFYREVGGAWQWEDRLVWSPEQWWAWVGRDSLETWVAFWEGVEAGYVELERQQEGSVEIVYFGLLPSMIGKGLGSGMLTLAVQRAWEVDGTSRVWLHTCSEDHPHALANYEKRGFRLFKTEEI